mgnify:CR=1 FL=1|tara:strand:+ start:1065 stop:1370 length:306 start_codon:yes stop_codon:yes gene_type:complete
MDILKPTLTENLSKFYIRTSLKDIRVKKNKYITIFINIFLFLLFIGSIGAFLYYKYKGKLTPEEKEIKDNQKKMYLFEKLHKISYEKHKENQNLITDLPLI